MFSTAPAVLSINDVSKHYRHTPAVEHLSLTLHPGEVCGFLGPNGAGKTTTMRMILGLVHPSQGSIMINGINVHTDPAHALQGVGAIIEESHFYPYLTGEQNLRQVVRLRGLQVSASDLTARLASVGLENAARRKVKGYSLGMRQRLGLALALIQAPKLLILDEPMNGLDPAAMREFRTHLAQMAQQSVTVLLSSHILTEVEQLATRLIFMKDGKMVGSEDDLTPKSAGLLIRITEQEKLGPWLSARHHAFHKESGGDIIVSVQQPTDGPAIIRALVHDDFEIVEVRPVAPTLESQYLERMTQPEEVLPHV